MRFDWRPTYHEQLGALAVQHPALAAHFSLVADLVTGLLGNQELNLRERLDGLQVQQEQGAADRQLIISTLANLGQMIRDVEEHGSPWGRKQAVRIAEEQDIQDKRIERLEDRVAAIERWLADGDTP